MATIFFDFNDWIDDQVLAAAGPNVRAFPKAVTSPDKFVHSVGDPKTSEVIDLAARRKARAQGLGK